MVKRIGPNFEDENRIKEWIAAGVTDPAEIGQKLNIEAEGVRIFMESLSDVDEEPEDEDEDED